VNEIERPRDAGEIIRDAFALYRAHPLAYLLIAFVVVVPVDIAVFGIGLGQLGGSYDSERSTGMLLLQVGVTLLVVTPLLTTMVIRALLAERPVSADLWIALAWCIGILLVAYAAATAIYRRRAA
jgi:hypothetical protein